METNTDKTIVSSKILAQVLHDLNPSKSVDEWEKHVNSTGDDPKDFFNGNGEGLEEYERFVKQYDKDIHERNKKRKNRRV